MNIRQIAVNLGAIDGPMPDRNELFRDVLQVMHYDIAFHRNTEHPQTYLIVAPTISECDDYAHRIHNAGLTVRVVSDGRGNAREVMRLVSAGHVSVVVMPTQTACCGGMSWPGDRLRLISMETMQPEHATRFLGIGSGLKHTSALVWLRPERPSLQVNVTPEKIEVSIKEPTKMAARYSNLMLELEADMTEAELDGLVNVLQQLKGVKSVNLGVVDNADRFVTEQRVSREIAKRVYDALYPPKKQE